MVALRPPSGEQARKMMAVEEIFPEECVVEAQDVAQIAAKSGKDVLDLHAELREVIRPYLQEINERTGQPNQLDYLAYALQYAMSQARQ